MSIYKSLALISCASVLAACASGPSQPQAAATPVAGSVVSSSPTSRLVKSIDGKYTGEVIGVIAEGSRYSKLKIGMSTEDVQAVFGRTPDRSHTYESGKRWIPFYFGNDARRMQVLYKDEGCLIFTGGNAWGGGGGDLIQIEADPSGKCYQQ
jgi:hypothetical protein